MRDAVSPFNQILDGLTHGEADGNLAPSDCPPVGYALGSTALPLGSITPGGDAAAAWNKALEWLADLAEPATSSRPGVLPNAEPMQVRRELGLHDALTANELQHIRRAFMWLNHPDRCPMIPGEIANQRVAVANMLIDEAVLMLTGPDRKPEPSTTKRREAGAANI